MSGGFPSSNISCSYTKPFDSQFNSCHKAADITLAAVPSTGIKLNSCPWESDILVYQATIWGHSKLYLRQKAKQSVSSCYEKDGPLNLSAATQKGSQPNHQQLLCGVWQTGYCNYYSFVTLFNTQGQCDWLLHSENKATNEEEHSINF